MRIARLAFLSLVLISCDRGAGVVRRGAGVHDSAGVRIVVVESSVWKDSDVWRVEPQPFLRIGASFQGTQPYLFGDGRTLEAKRLGNGVIVVVDPQAHELRAFSPSGEHMWTAGGPGSGPGEFGPGVRNLQRLPGDILQVDVGLATRRIRFDAQGSLLEDVRTPTDVLDRLGPWHTRCTPVPTVIGDFLVVGAGCVDEPQAGGRTKRATLIRVSWSSAIDTLGSVDLFDEWGYHKRGGGVGTIMTPSPSPGHSAVGGSNLEHLAVNNFRRYAIKVFALRVGRLEQIIIHGAGMRPPTQAELSEWFSVFDWRASGARFGLEREAALTPQFDRDINDARSHVPDSISIAGRMVYDRAGNLWVEHNVTRGDGLVPWVVYRPDGVLLGEVGIPGHIRVQDVGEDYVLGIITDEQGVPYVVLHRLHKP